MEKLKYILLFAFVFSFSAMFFSSCLDEDEDEVTIDEAWKLRNEEQFSEKASSGEGYQRWLSYAYGDQDEERPSYYIWHRPSSEIEVPGLDLRATIDGYPEFNDSVYCRYEGWYFTRENEKYIFDSTENPVNGSSTNPNKVSKGFVVGGVIEGFRTALYNMKTGDEQEIVIPWSLGYGSLASSSIPAYTTLYFRIKLLKVVPARGRN